MICSGPTGHVMRRVLVTLLVCTLPCAGWLSGDAFFSLPNRAESLKFAVIGDNGTGDAPQYELAAQMARARAQFPFDLVLMVGDNFYGSQKPADLAKKFDRPYKALLDAGVMFQASLGNHDELHTINYPPINMQGRRYYTFTRQNARFFVLDTNALDPPQIDWFRAQLAASRDEWKICYFHHPLYSNAGRHGGAVDVRVLLEPLLLEYGVHVVFSGHDHIYERLQPQNGIHYFITGSGGKLRKGDYRRTPTSAAGFDQDQAFLLVEIDGTDLFFETISRAGASVDSGTFKRPSRRSGT
jgi:predicted MPP superfamily phosphohydrolase